MTQLQKSIAQADDLELLAGSFLIRSMVIILEKKF
jgi:hypothetical protein